MLVVEVIRVESLLFLLWGFFVWRGDVWGDALCVFFSLIPDDLLLSFMMVESVVSVVCVCVSRFRPQWLVQICLARVTYHLRWGQLVQHLFPVNIDGGDIDENALFFPDVRNRWSWSWSMSL